MIWIVSPWIEPGHVVAAGHALGPLVEVVVGVGHHHRRAGRAGAHVHLAQLGLVHAQHPQRIRLAEILLVDERQVADVLRKLDVGGLDPRLVHLRPVEVVALVGPLYHGFQLIQLQRGKFVPRHSLSLLIPEPAHVLVS